ncbi:helix-turn-helix transcriptional regulator [Streptomyces sp. NPDC047046]|uniref:helix-turn-helix domain-containing protein n=1 Tax=Streptomyces sp. NPDC047046 TaxID=3155378 RepID=UPI0033F1914F
MTSSSDFDAARIALGNRLRALRRRKGITARALAAACGWHESKTSRVENGKTLPSDKDITKWTVACDAPAEAEELITMVLNIALLYVEWRDLERTGLRRAHDQARPLWNTTQRFKSYSQCLLPGILQTEEYTRAVLTGIRDRRNVPDDLEETVQARLERQQILRDGGKSFSIVLEETVLHYQLGDRPLMIEQLSRILTVSGYSNVSIGIIPRSMPRAGMWPVEDFWLFDDREASVETVSALLTLKQRTEVALYRDAFTRLHNLALHGSDLYPLIMGAFPSL